MSGLASSVRVWGRHAWLPTRMWYFGAHFINREFSQPRVECGCILYAAVLAYQLFESIWVFEFLLWNVSGMNRRVMHLTAMPLSFDYYEGIFRRQLFLFFECFLCVFFLGNLSGRPCLVEHEVCGSSVVNKVGWGRCIQFENLGFFYLLERSI